MPIKNIPSSSAQSSNNYLIYSFILFCHCNFSRFCCRCYYQSQLDADFVAEVIRELTTTLGELNKVPSSRTREYHLVCRNPLLYVHVFDKSELTSNCCVPTIAWDKFATIFCLQSVPPEPLPEPTISIDFRPVYMDNIALKEVGVTGSRFDSVLSGDTPSVNRLVLTGTREYGQVDCIGY